MDSTKRFLNRKKVLNKRKERHGLSVVVDNDLVKQYLDSDIDWDSVNKTERDLSSKYDFEFNSEVSEAEVQELLSSLESEFDNQRFETLVSACKNDVLSAVVLPFGLGGLVSSLDKNGGNVDTVNNVRDGVYSAIEEKKSYRNRGDYNSDEYHAHKNYRAKNREDAYKQEHGQLQDGYTENKITQQNNRDLDHTIAAKEIHDDRGRVLAELDGPEAANVYSNLTSTERSINRSKEQKSTEEFLKDLKDKKPERKARIEELSSKNELSDKESKDLKKLKALDSVDEQRIKEIDDNARKEYNKTINKKYYTSKKFAKNVAATGVNEGAKMGIQQALGLVLCEFFKATFDEIEDIYDNGFSSGYDEDRFFHVLKKRLSNIAARISEQWEDACYAFKNGFISGFLSNIVTVVINMFVRTGKRIVRIIREGFFSLLKAIKMLCFPPKDMTMLQAAHESSKLIATGLTIVGGIAVEQSLDSLIKTTPMLEPFADILTAVLVGALTGLSTTFIVYAIDKIDIFKVNNKQKHEFVMDKLGTSLNSMFERGDAIISELSFS